MQPLEPGVIIGEKYRLEESVGQGGMATVWRAVHTTLGRPVAVKFLEAVGVGANQLAERFLNEAKLAAGLRHRNVVDILDFGVTEKGQQPYMVMEFLAGSSLADRYTEGPPVSDWELLETVAMTLSGLAAVHDAGILHRDVKPENIFLVDDADGVYPKLLDFGVSKGFGNEGRMTRTGSVVGTPQYMSPEQARGKKDIGPRSDLWSMGIVLYEGFTGEVPFDSENPGDVLISVATEEIKPLSHARPDLPIAVTELVHKALRKDPAERFADAREMREAVMEILQHAEQMTGRPPSTRIRTAYASTPGTGQIRVLSMPPGLDTPAETPQVDIEEEPEVTIEPVRAPLPPSAFAMPAPQKKSGSWAAPITVVLLLAAAGGAYAAWDRGLIPFGPIRDGSAGELEAGEEVARAAREAELAGVELMAPPADGLPAPLTQTIDVPSPPDPPSAATEQSIGDDGIVAEDAGIATDAGDLQDTRPIRRRRPRRGAR